MTTLLIDSSVLIKWLHSNGEAELQESRSLRAAHLAGDVEARIIDLALYEVGNVLLRALRWSSDDVADQLDDLLTICGAPLTMTADWFHLAAKLAGEHRLSLYDASWAAAAGALEIPLVSADSRLLAACLAESPTDIASRLRLPGEPTG